MLSPIIDSDECAFTAKKSFTDTGRSLLQIERRRPMIPGGRMNPKQMQAMMKRMGITQEEMKDVEEVIIRLRDKEIVFKDASVTSVTVQGQKTYQIVGTPNERARTQGEMEEGGIPQEDIKLVMDQTGVTAAEAKKALEEAGGAPAEAILKIMSTR